MIKIEIGHIENGGYDHSCFEILSYKYTLGENGGAVLTMYVEATNHTNESMIIPITLAVKNIEYLKIDNEVFVDTLCNKHFMSEKFRRIIRSIETLNYGIDD